MLLTRHGRIGVYLAGLAVECALKALVLSEVPSSQRNQVDNSQDFRGRGGHSYEDLRRMYRRQTGGRDIPVEWSRDLRYIAGLWSVEMRYQPKLLRERDATAAWNAASNLVTGIRRKIS